MSTKFIPPIEQLLNIYDFQHAAKIKLLHPSNHKDKTKPIEEAHSYYETGVMDEFTLQENQRAFARFWLRPRILVGVKHTTNIDTTITLLNSKQKSSLPIFISSTARADYDAGEIIMMKAAYNQNIIYMIPSDLSCPFDQLIAHKSEHQTIWTQFYAPNKKYVDEYLTKAITNGINTICLTVDSPAHNKRERYLRVPGNEIWAGQI